MAEVIWTHQSIDDINNIAEFISKDSEKYAKLQVQEFFNATHVLEIYPYSGRIVPEINNKNIRELIIGFYRLIYSVSSKDKVVILTVHHSFRKLKKSTLRSKR